MNFSRQIFEKSSNIKFRENPCSGSRVLPCERTIGRTDMTKLTIPFRSFANAPKKKKPPQAGARAHTRLQRKGYRHAALPSLIFPCNISNYLKIAQCYYDFLFSTEVQVYRKKIGMNSPNNPRVLFLISHQLRQSKTIQGVTGGTDQTSGECSLGQTIPI